MNHRKLLGFSLGPVGAALISFISLPVMTWIFPPSAIGALSMLQVAISLSTVLFCLGLDQAYVREYHESVDKPTLLLNSALPGFIILIIALAGSMLLDPRFLSDLLFGPETKAIIFSLIVALCIVAAYLTRFLSLILRMQDRGFTYSMSQLLSKLLLLLIVIGYVLFTSSRDLMKLLLAQASALILTLMVFAWNTRYDWLPVIHAKFERNQLIRLLRFGWPLIFGGVASWGLAAMDRVFLRSMSNYSELAVYSVAASIASGVTIFAGIFNTIWAPMVYKWVADKVDMKRLDFISAQAIMIITLLVCLAGGCSWALGYLLPPTYERVPFLVVGNMVAPLLYTLSEITGIGIAISRRTAYSLASSFVAALSNALLCYLLVPKMGAAGATIATVCSFWLFFVLRTEFSALVWRKTSRGKLHVHVAIVLIFAISFAIFGKYLPTILTAIAWWVLLAGMIFMNRSNLIVLWDVIRGRVGQSAVMDVHK